MDHLVMDHLVMDHLVMDHLVLDQIVMDHLVTTYRSNRTAGGSTPLKKATPTVVRNAAHCPRGSICKFGAQQEVKDLDITVGVQLDDAVGAVDT